MELRVERNQLHVQARCGHGAGRGRGTIVIADGRSNPVRVGAVGEQWCQCTHHSARTPTSSELAVLLALEADRTSVRNDDHLVARVSSRAG